MANDQLPLVFAGSSLTRPIPLAVGVLLTVAGLAMIFDHESGRLVVGWLVVIVGLIIAILGLISLMRGCPRLELNNEGIFYRRCLQGTTRVAWSELDRIDIQKVRRPRPMGEIKLDCLILVTTDGRKIVISAPINPSQVEPVRETIMGFARRQSSSASSASPDPKIL